MSVTGQTDDAMESAAYERGYRAGAKLPSAEALAQSGEVIVTAYKVVGGHTRWSMTAAEWRLVLATIRRLRKRGKR